MEERELLRKELADLTEGAALLLDDKVYTRQSYMDLIVAIGCAKAALKEESTTPEELETAQIRLENAIDALVIRPDAPLPKSAPPKKKKNKLAPALVAGGIFGGLLLGRHLIKRKKKKK